MKQGNRFVTKTNEQETANFKKEWSKENRKVMKTNEAQTGA